MIFYFTLVDNKRIVRCIETFERCGDCGNLVHEYDVDFIGETLSKFYRLVFIAQ